jgi:hypothetical protein
MYLLGVQRRLNGYRLDGAQQLAQLGAPVATTHGP